MQNETIKNVSYMAVPSKEESEQSDLVSDKTNELINRAIYGLQRRKVADKPQQRDNLMSPRRPLNPLMVAHGLNNGYTLSPRSTTADRYTSARDSLLNRAR